VIKRHYCFVDIYFFHLNFHLVFDPIDDDLAV
jgi:hypothetical protein